MLVRRGVVLSVAPSSPGFLCSLPHVDGYLVQKAPLPWILGLCVPLAVQVTVDSRLTRPDFLAFPNIGFTWLIHYIFVKRMKKKNVKVKSLHLFLKLEYQLFLMKGISTGCSQDS